MTGRVLKDKIDKVMYRIDLNSRVPQKAFAVSVINTHIFKEISYA